MITSYAISNINSNSTSYNSLASNLLGNSYVINTSKTYIKNFSAELNLKYVSYNVVTSVTTSIPEIYSTSVLPTSTSTPNVSNDKIKIEIDSATTAESTILDRQVSPLLDLPERLLTTPVTTLDDIDQAYIDPSTNVANYFDKDLKEYIKIETLENNPTYWSTILNQKCNLLESSLEYYEHKDTFKLFDFFSYDIDNSYIDKIYKKIYNSFDNVRKYTKDSKNLIKTFSNYVSEDLDSCAIVFEGLKENETNYIENESCISVYLKHLRLTNEDIFFKTSYNVSIDYDGKIHFSNYEPAYITAYSTADIDIKKTVCVAPSSLDMIYGETNVDDVSKIELYMNVSNNENTYYSGNVIPSQYKNYEGEIILKNDELDFDKSKKYICKIFSDKTITKIDFTNKIDITENKNLNYIYGTVETIDKTHIRIKFIANMLSFLYDSSKLFAVKIYDGDNEIINFESVFVAKRLYNTRQSSNNPLRIKIDENEPEYFNEFKKTGLILEGNKTYKISIDESVGKLSSVYILNSTGGISTVIPKVRITSDTEAQVVALGKGSFDIIYSICDDKGKYTTYSDSFVIKDLKISHSSDSIGMEFNTTNGIITIKLNEFGTTMAPISIIAQYNSYYDSENNSNLVSEEKVKGFKTKYFYEENKWATIEIETANDVTKNNIPIRIYFIAYDNVIFYKDWNPNSTKSGFFSKIANTGKFIDYLGNEYAKNLKQPLYNIDKENHITPFVKVSLGLSSEPFEENRETINTTVVSKNILKFNFKTDVLAKTKGMPLSINQQKQILAIERNVAYAYSTSPKTNGKKYSLSYSLSYNVDKYLISQGFDVNEKIYKPSDISYVNNLRTTGVSNLTSSLSNSPIYAFDNIEDTDEVSVWNVIPNIKLNNPSLLFDITESFNSVRKGCLYRPTEKNFDIMLSKNSLLDSDFSENVINIKISDVDEINISFDMNIVNIIKNGHSITDYMIDESSIYINGKLDNNPISAKYVNNCSRNKSTGNVIVETLDNDSFTIVLSTKGSRKRVSCTFVINEYNVSNDDLLIDINPTQKTISTYNIGSFKGQYIQNSYDNLPATASNIWVSYDAFNAALKNNTSLTKKISLLKSSPLSSPVANSYLLCDIKNNVITQRYITSNFGEFSSTFVKTTERMPLDLKTVILTDDYYNAVFSNADTLPISKDYEYELCFDAEYILKRYKLFNNKSTIPDLVFETSDDGIEYVYDKTEKDSNKTELEKICLNIHIVCKNKMILIRKNVPITESFTFCYNDLYKTYGHINGLVLTDSNNNPIHSFSIDVSFEPFIKANIVTKRVFDTPILFFDDAASEIKYNRDYDNLLPSFTQYRTSLDSIKTESTKIGNLSKYDWNSSCSFVIKSKTTPAIYNGETVAYEDVIKDKDNNNIVNSMRYIGYFIYYLNMSMLKHLNWKKLTDSEDLIYYQVLLDKLNNSYDTFKEFKDNKNLKDISEIKQIHLWNKENVEYMTIDYIDFFRKNYDEIMSFWKTRIEAYSLLENVLKEYDETLTIPEQIEKYLDKLDSEDSEKREKIYYILTEKAITNEGYNETWTLNQLSNRLWDASSMHYIWKNVFNIMFEDQFDFSIINDAILRDIYDYGFYPIINVPVMTESNEVIPYNLDVDGEIKESKNDKNYIWNASSERAYEYMTNGTSIIGISRTLELEEPTYKTWKVEKIVDIDVLDKNDNSFYEYVITNDDNEELDYNEWGNLVCKDKKYNLNIKGEFKLAKSTKKNALHRKIITSYTTAYEDEILNRWIDKFYVTKKDETYTFVENDDVQKSLPTPLEKLDEIEFVRILKKEGYSKKYSILIDLEGQSIWEEISPMFIYDNWQEDTFYDIDKNLIEELPDETPEKVFIKNDFYKLEDESKYLKPFTIRYERLIGTDFNHTINYKKSDFDTYWIDEDRANLIKMKKVNLLEYIKIQRFLNELFVSELNKTTNMIDVLISFYEMKKIIDDMNNAWYTSDETKSKIKYDYRRLLDFNVTSIHSPYDCIYRDFKTFGCAYSYSYAYYYGPTHSIESKDNYGYISFELPTLSAKKNFIKEININDDLVTLNIIVPKNNVQPQKTAEITYKKYNGISYVYVNPINDAYGIEPFGIYPWNANKRNYSYMSSAQHIYAFPATWSNGDIDAEGIPNFRNYENISKYKEIDPDGWKNSMFVMNNIKSGKMDDCPAIRIAYNFYPEENKGKIYQKMTYSYVFTLTSSINANNSFTYTTYEMKIKSSEGWKPSEIYSYDLYLYPEEKIEFIKKIQDLKPIQLNSRTKISNLNSTSEYKYTYSYIVDNSHYRLSYTCYTTNLMETIKFDKLTGKTTSYTNRVGNTFSSGHIIANTNKISLPTNNRNNFSVLASNSAMLENILFNKDDNTTSKKESSTIKYTLSGSICYGNNESFSISYQDIPYTYMLTNYIEDIVKKYNPTSYTFNITHENTGLSYYVVDTKIEHVIEKTNDNIPQFFLGSVSQWQVVQDNVREINKALYDLKLAEDPDYFYDGLPSRNIPSGKLFWTSSEIDSNNAWMMFFDKNSIKNNLKNCSAYIRPFIKVSKKEGEA